MFRKLLEALQSWKAYKSDLKARHRVKYWIAEITELVITVLPAVLLVRAFVVQTSVIPSPSMVPTLKVGDRLFVIRFSYWFSPPKRGDIVVFKSEDGRDFVKRAVGLPGERVRIDRGDVYINDQLFVAPGVFVRRDTQGKDEILVPEDKYLVLGDNRPQSGDSRYWNCAPEKWHPEPVPSLSDKRCWGFVDIDQFKGKAWFTFWPLSRMRVLH